MPQQSQRLVDINGSAQWLIHERALLQTQAKIGCSSAYAGMLKPVSETLFFMLFTCCNVKRLRTVQWHQWGVRTGELMNLAVADSKVAEKQSCVAKFLDGEREDFLPKDMARLPDPFILDEHLLQLLEGLDPDAAVSLVEPAEGVQWLPDISFGHVGMPYRCNEYQVCSH
jgi:hypothetical protein